MNSLRLLEVVCPSPAENLALEEVLLEEVERGGPETLRLWESPVRFVVLGTSQRVAAEVHRDRCEAEGVPILRRCTAGGCVLQGPGSLNFTLALRYENHPGTQTLHGSYCHILKLLGDALRECGVEVVSRGACDLAADQLKVSGNAQRRKRFAFLHHGTLLHQLDLDGMERYLKEPADRPEYRGARRHREFVAALPLSAEKLRQAVRHAFQAPGPSSPLSPEEAAAVHRLAVEKYQTDAWNFRR